MSENATESDHRCICGGRHCRRCGVSVSAATAGVLCDPPFAGSHDFPPLVSPPGETTSPTVATKDEETAA